METLTWLSLALQLGALCSIVGALLLYLLRKVRGAEPAHGRRSKTVLVTSVDTALGLQIATYLSGRGWRVIGGCKSGGLGARLASSWAASHAPDAADDAPAPRLATVELDVAREDVMEHAARAAAQHLPAGEYGIWAVINTAGSSSGCWEGVLRNNVLGALRVARTFTPLLAAAAHKSGPVAIGTPRLFYIGLSSDTELDTDVVPRTDCDDAAAVAASRWAVCGAGAALRGVLKPRGIHVAVLHAPDLSATELFSPPQLVAAPPSSAPASRPDSPVSDAGTTTGSCAVSIGEAAEYSAMVLPPAALKTLEEALSCPAPRNVYHVHSAAGKWFQRVPSLRSK